MTTWILLRGLTRESRHWGSFPGLLSQALDGVPVICLDLPGNGLRWQESSPLTVAAMADFCHAQLLALNCVRPCRVLAMSLGAMVAVAWAERHPGDLDVAMLINTSMRPFSPFFRRLQPANYGRIFSLLLGSVTAEEIEGAVLDMTTTTRWTPPQREQILADWSRWRRECPVSRRNALRQLLAAAQFRAPLAAPDIDWRVLVSDGDHLVDSRCSRDLVARWDVPLVAHPTAGHDLPLDCPEWVIQQVLDVS
jgi:pimeloyl-ACP methyl ester carboxylesterase